MSALLPALLVCGLAQADGGRGPPPLDPADILRGAHVAWIDGERAGPNMQLGYPSGLAIIHVIPDGPLDGTVEALEIITQIGSVRLSDEQAAHQAWQRISTPTTLRLSRLRGSRWTSHVVRLVPVSRAEYDRRLVIETTDDITGAVVRRWKHSPHPVRGPTGIEVTIVNGTPVLCIRLAQGDWLFMEAVTVVVEGDQYRLNFALGGVKREVLSGTRSVGIREWVDLPVRDQGPERELIEALIDARSATVRFHGRTYIRDVELSRGDLWPLQVVLRDHQARARRNADKQPGPGGKLVPPGE